MKLLLIGNRGGTNVAACFERAAHQLGIAPTILEARLAMDGSRWVVRFNWWLRSRRPTRLRWFSHQVVAHCQREQPDLLITTGAAPLTREALCIIGTLGIWRVSYLTDDPWNPAHRATWFLDALPEYDTVFSPRRSILEDLHGLGMSAIHYLPFAYDPHLHFSEPPATAEEQEHYDADIVFIGTGDRDRVPLIAALAQQQFHISLYGSYWERFRATRLFTHGQADVSILRRATTGARVALCLVRRANRDGHVMRSFEIPAIGACMLVEDTAEHREIFGAEGEAVAYFRTIDEMIAKLRWLLDHDDERRRLAFAAHRRIVDGNHTYRDRLLTILNIADLGHTHMTAGSIGKAL
jgi:spore maturation protein CgeB